MTAHGGRERATGEPAIEHCAYCRRGAPTGDSCTTDTITFPDGTVEAAIAYDEENTTKVAERCPGCGVARGGYHHPFCPDEECPRCGRRLMRCGCLDTDCVSRKWLR